MKRYCLTLDLKNDPKLIAEYKKHHDNIWLEITKVSAMPVLVTWKSIFWVRGFL
jgi:L-rhamnose mutarotase